MRFLWALWAPWGLGYESKHSRSLVELRQAAVARRVHQFADGVCVVVGVPRANASVLVYTERANPVGLGAGFLLMDPVEHTVWMVHQHVSDGLVRLLLQRICHDGGHEVREKVPQL